MSPVWVQVLQGVAGFALVATLVGLGVLAWMKS